MQLSAEDIAELTRLEEAMWIAATRFDLAFQRERFAPDFFEFGRSGRAYAREQLILEGGGEIKAQLPLDALHIRPLDAATHKGGGDDVARSVSSSWVGEATRQPSSLSP